jgi:hypothetical protein
LHVEQGSSPGEDFDARGVLAYTADGVASHPHVLTTGQICQIVAYPLDDDVDGLAGRGAATVPPVLR